MAPKMPPKMAPKEDLLRLDRQLCFQLYLASKSMIQAYAPLLEPLGLTYLQYLVMMVLWESGELSVKALGGKLHLDSGTLSPLLKRLLAKKLIVKTRAEADERSVVIRLTGEGRALKARAQNVPQRLMECSGLKAEEARKLFRAVQGLNSRLEG
jgi:MarR family transcriptional regulator, organic hydroperoxide resistance regulator